METNVIIQGDCLQVLKTMPSESIDLVITSPPYYGLRDYQVEGQIGLEESFEDYQNRLLEVMEELKRILKKTGSIFWNIGDVFASKCLLMMPERFAIKCVDKLGLILRQKIIWAKQILLKKENRTIGSVIPTSVKDRFNLSFEYLYHFVKSKKYYSNLDEVRLPNQVMGVIDFRNPIGLTQTLYKKSKYRTDYSPQGSSQFNYRVRDAKRKAGQPQFKASEEEIRKYTLKYRGKFLSISGNVEMFNSPTARLLRKRAYSQRKQALKEHFNKRGSGGNYDYGGIESPEAKHNHPLGKNIPTVWVINPEPHNFQKELGVSVDHFAVYPEALVEIPIKFACPPDGIVLDPFAGSCTTAVVAKKLKRKFIMIELSQDYCEIGRRRLLTVPDSLF